MGSRESAAVCNISGLIVLPAGTKYIICLLLYGLAPQPASVRWPTVSSSVLKLLGGFTSEGGCEMSLF